MHSYTAFDKKNTQHQADWKTFINILFWIKKNQFSIIINLMIWLSKYVIQSTSKTSELYNFSIQLLYLNKSYINLPITAFSLPFMGSHIGKGAKATRKKKYPGTISSNKIYQGMFSETSILKIMQSKVAIW